MADLDAPAADLVRDQVGVMTSRRLPRWIGPEGESPDATTTGLPGARRSASAMTSSAKRETQSVSVLL